jgi:hypothetical protein
MTQIVEVDERGAIQLPTEILKTVKPHARFALEQRGATIVLRPLSDAPHWLSATPEERAAAIRQWDALDRPPAPSLSDEATSREHMYNE